MAITVVIMPSAERDLQAIGAVAARRVLEKLRTIEREGRLVGDVKRLTGQPARFRLRVGDYRVLFLLEADTMKVYRILHRREAYE
ncbi:MAG: type II toxin-antitoxin system RelE/ParE family toxin [Planctomycetes bacterium]|nr:type II toxin-antitoxin system RelE/ParE family toxin [Planctomycetota bacterium]